MKAQALSDDSRASYMRGKKTLEINPRHPLIKTLRERSIEDPESEETKELATVLYVTEMLVSGFAFDQPGFFAGWLFSLVRNNMGIDENAEVDAEDADIEDEEEAAEDAEKGKDEL